MDVESKITLVTSILGIAIIIIGAVVNSTNESKVSDPNDERFISIFDLESKSKLYKNGQYLVRCFRQSGNLQKEDKIFYDHSSAINAALSTLKRAKIFSVAVTENTHDKLYFRRISYSHGGSAEGKKVGSIEIHLVNATNNGKF